MHHSLASQNQIGKARSQGACASIKIHDIAKVRTEYSLKDYVQQDLSMAQNHS